MKLLHTILIMLSLLFIYGCEKYKVDEVIQLSGNNKLELEKVLSYYSKEVPDKEKLKAAKFLISNMKWHKSIVTTDSIRIANSFLDSLIYQADSILYNTVFEDSIYDIKTPKPLIDAQIEFKRKNYEYSKKYSPKTSNKERYDYEYLSAKQLIEHIDFAFSLKHSSPYLKDISFEDFCEYVLPYRAVPDMPVVDFPKFYAKLFNKHLKNIEADSTQQIVNKYNSTIIRLRNFFILTSYNDELIGYRELLYKKNIDCIKLANYAALALRAYGLPVATEYNIAYKQLQGKHHRCAILTQNKNWVRWSLDAMRTFTEESNYIQNSGSMNLYRYTYSAQKDAPYFRHEVGEFIPEELSSPCIKDVTSEIINTISLSLPFNAKCSNKIAYLATFNSGEPEGWTVVTWGNIHKGKVTFQHVIPERLYFLIYYTPIGSPVIVDAPFYIDSVGKITKFIANYTDSKKAIIHRKFPYKPTLIEKAQTLVGAVITASNNMNFVQKDTVGIITNSPLFYYQDIKLNMDKGPYQYYRIQTKENRPLHLAEAQLLTEQKYGYKEVLPATPLPILSPNDTLFIQNKIRLKEHSTNQWASDGNPLTVAYNPTIIFSLKRPCFATYFRFLPINSDNNISPENIYQLQCWSHEKWIVWKNDTAKYNFLEYNLFPGELYWLKCLSGGKEESPFTIDKEGNVKFIYETKIPKNKRQKI